LKTKYAVVNTGKNVEIDISDKKASAFVESKIQIKELEAIETELREAGLTGAKAKAKPVVEDEDEDEEDEKPVRKAKRTPKDEDEKPTRKVAEKVVKPAKKVIKGKKAKDDDDEW
jgi:hypothetical protein